MKIQNHNRIDLHGQHKNMKKHCETHDWLLASHMKMLFLLGPFPTRRVVFRCFECANRLRWLEFLEVSPSSTNLTSTVTTCQELLRFQEERRIAAMVKLAERDRQDRQARCSSLGSAHGKSYGVLPYLGLMNIHLSCLSWCATYTVGMNKRVQYQLFDSYPDDFRWGWFCLVVFLNKMKGKVSRISDKITEFECLLRAHLESFGHVFMGLTGTKGFSMKIMKCSGFLYKIQNFNQNMWKLFPRHIKAWT